MAAPDQLLHTPLYDLHLELGAQMVGFAGYAMPLQYKLGVMGEHNHTRASAGLFDVSHMGQVTITPRSGKLQDAALALEKIVPVDVLGLKQGRQRYGLFTNPAGGIMDDLMIANRGDHLFLVINAACKHADFAHMQAALSDTCQLEMLEDRALLALQGPVAEAALGALNPEAADMRFMDVRSFAVAGADCIVSRSGYTGEDGYEISVPAAQAVTVAKALLAQQGVEPIGLGARDSLRLEAGLCLYGNDIDTSTTPVEAALEWAVQKVRRAGGARAGGFVGADHILPQFEAGAPRRRVGLKPQGRAPIRRDVPLFAHEADTTPIGVVTSGVFGPTVQAPVAMGYVAADYAVAGTVIFAEVRGKRLPVDVAVLPFITPTYKR